MMDERPMTCEQVDQHELDIRYLAGRLSDSEAAAFEEHYFGCDRCWGLVKGGAGVRAAMGDGAVVRAVRPRAWWKPLAIAAGLAVVALGVWRLVPSREPADRDAIRGVGDSIAVQSVLSAGSWRAAWPVVSEAASYRVRIFAGDGRLLFTRQVTDTTIGLSADSLAAIGQGAPLYVDVQGFDVLRRPVGRSPLILLRDRP
jgi:hypothetical protein